MPQMQYIKNNQISSRIFFAVMMTVCLASPVYGGPSESLIEARSHSSDADINMVTFRTMREFFPIETVEKHRASRLKRRRIPLNPDVVMGEETLAFQDALKRTYTNGILVIKGGRVVYEQYLNGATEKSQFISWSVAKSVTSVLVGKAFESGAIKSLDDAVESYLPDLRGTAFEGVTIENLLKMRAGTSYKEWSPDKNEIIHSSINRDRGMYRNEKHYSDVEGLGLKRLHEPGSVFNYSTMTAGILGRVVEKATGMSLAKYTEKILWKPAGMEAQGYWLLDGEPGQGVALAGGGFNAVLRDYGRFGLMMLNGGRANGRQIIPEDWVRQSTTYSEGLPVIEGEPWGYQYQWWTMLDTERYVAMGIHGQFIFIDPAADMVIVKLSYWPEKGGPVYENETLAVFDAIRNSLK